ncbi:MAG: peptidyl-prolyl cis-trans isomerase, partial [Myxococcales bacterium]|nr:peptidyl-prolyl cis-trans isomerase [Myxococcales bacterium]
CPRPSWARFAAAARTHSDGPTRSRGGLLGAWPPGRMVKPFEAAIASLRHGECRGPVETRFGFHIVLRLDPRRLPTP